MVRTLPSFIRQMSHERLLSSLEDHVLPKRAQSLHTSLISWKARHDCTKWCDNHLNGMLFVPFVTFDQVQYVITEHLLCARHCPKWFRGTNKMGLVRAAALHTSRGTNCQELSSSVALDLSSVLQSDDSTATNERKNYQKKVQTTRREQKGEEKRERKEGRREREGGREARGKEERKREGDPVSPIALGRCRTGKKEMWSLRWALKDGQNLSIAMMVKATMATAAGSTHDQLYLI